MLCCFDIREVFEQEFGQCGGLRDVCVCHHIILHHSCRARDDNTAFRERVERCVLESRIKVYDKADANRNVCVQPLLMMDRAFNLARQLMNIDCFGKKYG